MKTEKGLIIVVLIALTLKILHLPFSGAILTMTLMTLAMLYFTGVIYLFSDNEQKKQHRMLSVATGLSLSIITLGILFKLQYWPDAQSTLAIGAISSLIILGITFLLKTKAAEDFKTYYKHMTIRTGVFIFIAALLYFTPKATQVKIQYWNDPEMARIKTLHYSYPENKEYQKQMIGL